MIVELRIMTILGQMLSREDVEDVGDGVFAIDALRGVVVSSIVASWQVQVVVEEENDETLADLMLIVLLSIGARLITIRHQLS